MAPSSSGLPARVRQTDFIREVPAKNLHHGIRAAKKIGCTLNLFVTVNFGHTSCDPLKVSAAFARVREHFGKWVSRPPLRLKKHKAQPTFVWVLENPDGKPHAHWLVHVPKDRQNDFATKLEEWLWKETGDVASDHAINIKEAYRPMGAQKYMLKGMYKEVAEKFHIRPEYQGWIAGRRIGHSKNVGPVQIRRLRVEGLYPKSRPWIVARKSSR